MGTVTCAEVKRRVQEGAVLLDVLTPEEYSRCHLPGALNACIYEVAFPEAAEKLLPDRSVPIVVYDATGTTRTAPLARERLLAMGYRDVSVLEGGLAAWRAAGNPLEPATGEVPAEPPILDRTYRIDPEQSVLEWIGRNLNNRHYGRIDLTGGEIAVNGGRLVSGQITLDMDSISNLDLQDGVFRRMLLAHLKSEDFFAVARFPTAGILLTGSEAIDGATPGSPNYTVQGELTIKGNPREIRFPAIIAPQEDGSLKAQATIDFDRTHWGVGYGSGRLFERLGMHLVHDMVSIELFIVAR